jgi:hypothetical protein
MSPELSAFVTANGTVLIVVLGALAAVGIVQWRKARTAEQEFEYKKALLDRGTPVEEIERATAAKEPGAPARRGLLEQFGALSGGTKAGIIFAVVVALSMAGSAFHTVAFWSSVREHRSGAPQPGSEVPPAEHADTIAGHAFYLDLQPVANQKLADVTGDNGHSLARLPQKRREFAGVPFQVGPGYVRLKGKNRPELPAAASGVRVGFKFDRLHVLHGTEYGAFGDASHRYHVPEGTEIGRYRVRYADGGEQTVPVVYGQDVRDAWNWDKSRPVSRGKVAWTGTSPGAAKEGVNLRLYLTTWTNTRPDAEVATIDFVSAGDTAASPFCVALTAERAAK